MSKASPTSITAPPGGVMTATDAGVISGELILRVSFGADATKVEVAYAETDDWYPVEGSPLRPPETTDRNEETARIAAHLAHDPGVDAHGNARHTDLTDLAGPPQPV
ncbi:hypothetical protein [Miltoncostaea oceani]|uniref:hypothetical protein n=1 Tax=Miltoncostaea oceani TaxID=2843216 RepID=UPI001C3DEA0C|nr:hypothetical protein [Miltoncostaea oceani]